MSALKGKLLKAADDSEKIKDANNSMS